MLGGGADLEDHRFDPELDDPVGARDVDRVLPARGARVLVAAEHRVVQGHAAAEGLGHHLSSEGEVEGYRRHRLIGALRVRRVHQSVQVIIDAVVAVLGVDADDTAVGRADQAVLAQTRLAHTVGARDGDVDALIGVVADLRRDARVARAATAIVTALLPVTTGFAGADAAVSDAGRAGFRTVADTVATLEAVPAVGGADQAVLVSVADRIPAVDGGELARLNEVAGASRGALTTDPTTAVVAAVFAFAGGDARAVGRAGVEGFVTDTVAVATEDDGCEVQALARVIAHFAGRAGAVQVVTAEAATAVFPAAHPLA